MLEPLAINLVAGGLSSVGAIGADKVRDILRSNRFSKDIDDLTTVFSDALKESLETAVEEGGYSQLQGIRANWTTIAEELDELDVVFEDEQEAIVRITDAVAAGLEVDIETRPQLRNSLEAAVAGAYQTALHEFVERVVDSDLADVFDTETNIELTATVNQLEDQLHTIQRQLRSQRTASLQNAGITWLDPLYFQRHEPDNPDSAWRTGFGFAEVAAGYPLPRERPPKHDEGERERLTSEIIDRLDDGEDLVVLGDGGSGKSTVCKQVAYQWYTDDRGPVFYRSSTARTAFDEPGPLIQAIRDTDDEVLVVVEDAATDETAPAYDVLEEFEHTADVSFLFDSRESAWRDTDELAGAPGLKQQRQRLGVVNIPTFDKPECQRAIDHYEVLTGETTGLTSKQLHEELRGVDVGKGLILAYELVGVATLGTTQGVSALHDDVHRAYSRVSKFAGDEDFPQIVAMQINILNAAQLPVEAALIHALATDRDKHRAIERALGVLEGTMLDAGASTLGTPHPVWSVLYLERVLKEAGERLAREYFEQCFEALFQLFDDKQRREEVISWLRNEPEILKRIDQAPEEEAGRFVRRLADLGDDRATVGVLYGRPSTWRVSFPDACSTEAVATWYINQGITQLNRGALDAAEEYYEESLAIYQKVEHRTVKHRASTTLAWSLNGVASSILPRSTTKKASLSSKRSATDIAKRRVLVTWG